MTRTSRYHGAYETQYATVGRWQPSSQRVTEHIVTHSRRLAYEFQTHFHPYAEDLTRTLLEKDFEGLQAYDTEKELKADFFDATYAPELSPTAAARVIDRDVDAPGATGPSLLPRKLLAFDHRAPYAVYNWELFFHLPHLLAVHCLRNSRFEQAQRYLRLIFDPHDNGPGPAPQRFWKFQPFRVDDVEHVEKTLLNLATGDDESLRKATVSAIGAWRDQPFNPYLVARARPTEFMLATVMTWLDIELAWGDSLFARELPEAIDEARVHYINAANLLGTLPQALPRKGTIQRQTYADLRANLDEFGNAARELEADIPFDLLPVASASFGSDEDVVLASLGRSLYFCIPRNEKLLGYWDTVADRLFKIRNSLSLQGTFRQLPLFAPPIDPALLARAAAAGVDVASIVAGASAPLSPLRFPVLLQRALEACQEAKSLGAQLLPALEKKDAEALALLRAKHESNLVSLAEGVRYAQWQEAIKSREGVSASFATAQQRFRYYERLLGKKESSLPSLADLEPDALFSGALQPTTEPSVPAATIAFDTPLESGSTLSTREQHELRRLEASQGLTDGAAALDGIGTFLNLIPTISTDLKPIGIGAGTRIGGMNLSQMLSGMANVLRGAAARASYEAGRSGRLASQDRREQEWTFQRNSAAAELTQLYKQLRAAEIREHIARREYDNHQKQLGQVRDVEDFLSNEKRRTTTANFYLWLQREVQGLHSRCFQFALDVAKKAERAFGYELAEQSASFINSNYLEGREGLLAAEKLYLDLKRMDLAYLEGNTRKFEIVQQVSLRDWFPLALLELRASGRCQIEIPEALLDLACPALWARTLQSIAVTIPAVTGPFIGMHCRLGLSKSLVRRRTGLVEEKWRPADAESLDPGRFVTYYSHPGASAIVTSSAQSDTGTFEPPHSREEQFSAFAGAGAISSLTLQLLDMPHAFDHDTVSDVILTLRYRGLESGQHIAAVASAEAGEWLARHAAQLLSVRHEFPSDWQLFKATGQTKLSFELSGHHFPYRIRDSVAQVRRIHVFTDANVTGEVSLALGPPAALRELGKISLANGEGELPVVSDDGEPSTVDPRARFELRFESNELDDLWLIFDWSPGEEGDVLG